MKRAMLVYQGGMANVFEVKAFNLVDYGRDAKRLMQGDFKTCELFALGLGAAGVMVRSAACNMAGDIINQRWTEDLEAQPFFESFRPVTANTTGVRAAEILLSDLREHVEKMAELARAAGLDGDIVAEYLARQTRILDEFD
jgi:hypothetical protein